MSSVSTRVAGKKFERFPNQQQKCLSIKSTSSSLSLPQCSANDVIIRIAFCDENQRVIDEQSNWQRRDPAATAEFSFSPVFGGSGVVEEIGASVPHQQIRRGKRVAFLGDPSRQCSSYSTYVAVDFRLVVEIPSNVSLREGAAVAVAGFTAFESLAKLDLWKNSASSMSKKSKLLVLGGGGSIGSWAIQLARNWHPKITIIATAGTEDSREWCVRMGANEVVSEGEILNLQYRLSRDGCSCVGHILCLTEPTPEMRRIMSTVIQQQSGRICLVVPGDIDNQFKRQPLSFRDDKVSIDVVITNIRTRFKRIQPSKEIGAMLQKLSLKAAQMPFSQKAADDLHQISIPAVTSTWSEITGADSFSEKIVLRIGSDTI